MTDGAGLRAIVEREEPDVIIPEIEQIDTGELVRLESEGWTVIPGADATRITMDRERIRRLGAERARVPTTAFAFADSPKEARAAALRIGLPCVFKAITSSSGHGMTVVRKESDIETAYQEAASGGRVANPRIMVEEFLPFDLEVTVLTLRHYAPNRSVTTTVMAPIGHARPSTLYHESWQPAVLTRGVVRDLEKTATAVTDQLGGVGIYGVECFVRGDDVYFSEVSPRPHDTGLVTLGSQWNSEFALHARAILGLPYVGPEPVTPAAAHVILASSAGWAPSYGGLQRALTPAGVRLYLFGKPEAYADRRLGVAVARAESIPRARQLSADSAHTVEKAITVGSPRAGGPA
jgi:phosphoribosylglycinamide formyltransferase 2